MMVRRLKIYYPNSHITRGLYTEGGEWMTQDAKEYVGPYHRYITGEVYTYAEWNERLSQKLLPFEVISPVVLQYRNAMYGVENPITREMTHVKSGQDIINYTAPKHRIVKPSEDDYKRGYMTRYIVGKRNDIQYPLREVLQDDMEAFESAFVGMNKFLYKIIDIKWKLVGPEYDIIEQNRIVESGIVDTNKRTVFSANRKLFGVSNFLRNLRQFSHLDHSPLTRRENFTL